MRDESIHPRVENGRTRHEKVNTSRSPLRSTVQRKIAAIEAHLARPDQQRNEKPKSHLSKLTSRLGSTA